MTLTMMMMMLYDGCVLMLFHGRSVLFKMVYSELLRREYCKTKLKTILIVNFDEVNQDKDFIIKPISENGPKFQF